MILRILTALLMSLPVGQVYGDPTIEQSSAETDYSSGVIRIDGTDDHGDGTDDWRAPTSGNLLILCGGGRSVNSSEVFMLPPGFKLLNKYDGASATQAVGFLACKDATGSGEGDLKIDSGVTNVTWGAAAIEVSGLEANACANAVGSAEDESKAGTAGSTSVGSGTLTSTNPGFAAFCSAQEFYDRWDTGESYSNGYREIFQGGFSSNGGYRLATKTVMGAGDQTTALSTNGSGSGAYGSGALFQTNSTPAGSVHDTSGAGTNGDTTGSPQPDPAPAGRWIRYTLNRTVER